MEYVEPSSLSAYKEHALLFLAFLVPPAAIVVQKSKADLESRHLALSLALYLSVICYLPSVIHAYWLLYVRDNGGLQEWTRARLKQVKDVWNEHGGLAKTTVDKYAPMVIEKFVPVRTYAIEKVKYVRSKKDEAVERFERVRIYTTDRVAYVRCTTYETLVYMTETAKAARELFVEVREAHAAGRTVSWSTRKMTGAVERALYHRAKSYLEPYPRVHGCVDYAELRVPQVIEFLGNIYQTIRTTTGF